MSMNKNYTWVLTSGRACLPYFSEALGYDEKAVKVMSLPRVDKLTDDEFARSAVKRVRERYSRFGGKKIVVYAPTFRKDKDISREIDDLAEKFDDSEYILSLIHIWNEIAEARERVYKAFSDLRDKKVVLIAPTYRGRKVEDAHYDFEQLGLDFLAGYLGNKYHIITKWHPACLLYTS